MCFGTLSDWQLAGRGASHHCTLGPMVCVTRGPTNGTHVVDASAVAVAVAVGVGCAVVLVGTAKAKLDKYRNPDCQ